jgi:monoamine oxidase
VAHAERDLVVVGAGAAGLAAARRGRELGLDPLVLEAKDRIGGRAWTDTFSLGVPWERGANWLHEAERNLFRRYAYEAGFAYERRRPERRLWSEGRFDSALRAELDAYEESARDAIAAAAAAGRDVAAAEVIPPHPRFGPLSEPWFAAMNGIEAARMSTVDAARAALTGSAWRVEAGYGALLAHFGREVAVELVTPVERIRWGARPLQVETARGRLDAAAVLVTVSTNVLASGRIAFEPPLPAARRDALAAVPTGHANKVALAFARNPFGCEDAFSLRIEHPRHAAFFFEVRPFGRELAIGHLGGQWALEAELAGPDAMAELATAALEHAFGSAVRRQRRDFAATAWCRDPEILGGYSCALAGEAHRRPVLAEPLDERLFFAGEACSLGAFGTVHGAAETGIAAAEAVAQRLQPGRRVADDAPRSAMARGEHLDRVAEAAQLEAPERSEPARAVRRERRR